MATKQEEAGEIAEVYVARKHTLESGMAEKVVTPNDFPAKGESTISHGGDHSHFPAQVYERT
ncbi:hypothetical protein CTI12_AA544100 [Artemisia annua]|uniref:Uncharacterized protein n=1 Tax=Artemisia annua TaxID=35608 RepID=A0A2U1L038_ARTAN|nr:hypothetical protein CTI12_AA544100 [Artemisia annua]